MRLKVLLASSAAVLAFALSAGSASAATEFGDTCAADEVAEVEYTLTTLSAPPAALPLTAPTGGVITKLKVNSQVPLPFAVPTQVKVLRSAGGNNYTVIGQQTVSAGPGVTIVDARIPVQAGDRLGLRGVPFSYSGSPVPSLALLCFTGVEGVLGAALGDVPPGSTAEFPPATVAHVPLAAMVEPDADNDGYGDETQDKCPQSAALQTACPTVSLDVIPRVRKTSILLLVTASSEARVKATGQVKWGFKPKPKSKRAQASKHNLIIGLSGGTQTVKPGQIARFVVKLPTRVTSRLRGLAPKQSLKAKLTATATDLAGRKTTKRVTVKLKGQKLG